MRPDDPHGGGRVERAGAPLGEGRAVVVMVHGRGAGPRNILDLVPGLGLPQLTYLAPAAYDRSWYPLRFMDPIASNEPHLASALRRIADLVSEVEAAGVPRRLITLLGFSQGACLAAEFMFHNPARYGGLVVLSGGLIGPPGTVWSEAGSFDRMPVFFGCSDVDSHIPKDRVLESAAVFERMGAQVTTRLYPGMGHLVNDDEVAHARAVLAQVVEASV